MGFVCLFYAVATCKTVLSPCTVNPTQGYSIRSCITACTSRSFTSAVSISVVQDHFSAEPGSRFTSARLNATFPQNASPSFYIRGSGLRSKYDAPQEKGVRWCWWWSPSQMTHPRRSVRWIKWHKRCRNRAATSALVWATRNLIVDARVEKK